MSNPMEESSPLGCIFVSRSRTHKTTKRAAYARPFRTQITYLTSIYHLRAFTDNYPSGSVLASVLREQARVKKRELAEIREIFVRRRRPMPMKILVPSCVPDAARTHALRVYLSEALVYI